MNSDGAVYPAAWGREYLRGELEDKPNEYIREFAGLIQDEEALDLLNYYSALWADEDREFLDTRLANEIISSAATKSADRAFYDGNASVLQGMMGVTNQSQDGGDVLSIAARQLMHEGAIGLVLGPPGAGKTAMTLDVARSWGARTGGELIGNTSWEGFDARITSDKELLETMASTEGPVLAVIDETAQDLSGFGAGNKKAETFANALTFIRKSEEIHGPYAKRGSVLMVNHTRKRTAAPFRRLANFALEKPSRDDPGRVRVLETEGGKDKFEEGAEHKGLTDTRERYAEHEASEFSIVMGDDDQEGDDLDPDTIKRESAIAAALRAVKPWNDDKGATYADAADIVGYSSGWVSSRVSEWREGEYREMVNRGSGAD